MAPAGATTNKTHSNNINFRAVEKVPGAHFHWGELADPRLIAVWVIATLWLKFSDENNMERATMYLMTRSDRDARRMVLIPLLGTLVGPLIWFIPSMAATILHPNLATEFPALKQPQEAAFVINNLVRARAAIPLHANEEATKDGKLNPKSLTAEFIKHTKVPVHVPLSGKTMEFNKDAKCVTGCGK